LLDPEHPKSLVLLSLSNLVARLLYMSENNETQCREGVDGAMG